MLNSKKAISALLALSLMTAYPASVCSAETVSPSDVVYSVDNGRSINWTYISFVGAGFQFDEDHGRCIGSYELYDDMKAVMTVTLMKSSDREHWSAVESWDVTNYTYNPSSLSISSTNELEHKYYYRTHVQVQVYESSNSSNVVENGNSFSGVKYYS